jgi:hypothetical protein
MRALSGRSETCHKELGGGAGEEVELSKIDNVVYILETISYFSTIFEHSRVRYIVIRQKKLSSLEKEGSP